MQAALGEHILELIIHVCIIVLHRLICLAYQEKNCSPENFIPIYYKAIFQSLFHSPVHSRDNTQ